MSYNTFKIGIWYCSNATTTNNTLYDNDICSNVWAVRFTYTIDPYDLRRDQFDNVVRIWARKWALNILMNILNKLFYNM